METKITAVIIAKNEADMLANCLDTLSWADRVLVIDNGSDDTTPDIAENYGAQVIHFEHSSFARLRNEALKHIDTQWLVYVDADERFTPTLAKEVLVHMETDDAQALTINRKNICYGQEFAYGGWAEDQVTRVFKKKAITNWEGKVHETPVYEGEAIVLHTPLIHLTHRSTSDNLNKTAVWTKIEAELLHKAGIPPVTFFTILRKGVMEFIRRAIIWRGYKDGLAGLIEALVQGINKILVYIQVWEMQQTPDLKEQYRRHEINIIKQWDDEDVSHLKEITS